MYLVQVVTAIGIVLATVLVAAGRGDGLPPADVSRGRTPVPAEEPFAAADLERVRLGVSIRGYRMDEVDTLLDRVALELASRDERIAELERLRSISSLRPSVERPDYSGGEPVGNTDAPPGSF